MEGLANIEVIHPPNTLDHHVKVDAYMDMR